MVRRTMSYALVALSLPLRQSFTYRVPDALEAEARPGAMVEVPLRGLSVRGVVLARVRSSERADAQAVADADFNWLAKSLDRGLERLTC